MSTHRIWLLTLFPEYFGPLVERGVAGQALRGERGQSLELKTVQIRHFSPKDYKGVDGAPFGGGPGMVMRADVLEKALLEGVVGPGGYGENFREQLHIVYTGPRGDVWSNRRAKEFAHHVWGETPKDVVIICGRYEGIDERFLGRYVDQEISLGDFVLTGGEIAALAILDSALRFLPGVLGNRESAESESFQGDLLEHPQYTRPREFHGEGVPEVYLSGNHKKIEEYKQSERERVTRLHRPDLYEKYLSTKDKS